MRINMRNGRLEAKGGGRRLMILLAMSVSLAIGSVPALAAAELSISTMGVSTLSGRSFVNVSVSIEVTPDQGSFEYRIDFTLSRGGGAPIPVGTLSGLSYFPVLGKNNCVSGICTGKCTIKLNGEKTGGKCELDGSECYCSVTTPNSLELNDLQAGDVITAVVTPDPSVTELNTADNSMDFTFE